MAFRKVGHYIAWLCTVGALIASLTFAFVPAYAYAEEVTGEATTEVYLVKTDDGTNPNDGGNTDSGTTTTTITTTTTEGDGSSTSSTGDTTPVIPIVAIGVVAAISIICAKKLGNTKSNGGENL